MSRCSRCDIEVRGDWTDCPLCGAGLRSVTEPTPAPWPDVPPRFDVGQLLRVLLLVSVLIVVSGLLALRLFFPGPFEGLRLLVRTGRALAGGHWAPSCNESSSSLQTTRPICLACHIVPSRARSVDNSSTTSKLDYGPRTERSGL